MIILKQQMKIDSIFQIKPTGEIESFGNVRKFTVL